MRSDAFACDPMRFMPTTITITTTTTITTTATTTATTTTTATNQKQYQLHNNSRRSADKPTHKYIFYLEMIKFIGK